MAPLLPADPHLWGPSVLHLRDMFARSPAPLVTLFFALSALPGLALPSIKNARASIDPCAAIAGKKWVAPSDVRACFASFQVDPDEKTNVGDNYSLPPPSLRIYLLCNYQIITAAIRFLDFHTSTNYQIKAPEPFTADVHEDIIYDLKRINRTQYNNDLELHIDISRSFKRLEDGHAGYVNYCYDGMKSSLGSPSIRV